MSDTAFVTGGTRGLGYAATEALLRNDPGRHVVLAVRDPAAGADVAERLATVTGNSNIHLVACDLASLDSVRAAATALEKLLDDGLPPFRGLLANAGIQRLDTTGRTRDGYELTFGTNVLGHYLLVRLLLEHLVTPARVVLVTSDTHWGDLRHTGGMVAPPRWADVDVLARPTNERPASARAATTTYTTSKLALIYLAHELARRAPDGVLVYSYNPGLIPGTGLAREAGAPSRLLWRTVFHATRVLPGVSGVRPAGHTLAGALTGPPPADSGAYLDRGRPVASSPASYAPDRERELWTAAARLVGLEP